MKNNNYTESEKIRIVYAGAPFGSRDTIANAIKGLLILDKESRDCFSFIFAGVNREQMHKLGLSYDELNQADKYCQYLGRVSHEKVLDIYGSSDYSLLLKPKNKRLSKAGFPTKVSESWSLSTPVIANLTGDMDMFMVDLYNGIISKSDSPSDFANALLKAKKITKKEYLRMRHNSRETAETKLDKSIFAKEISDFIQEH